MDFEHLTVKELREKLDSKEVSAVELTKAYLCLLYTSRCV